MPDHTKKVDMRLYPVMQDISCFRFHLSHQTTMKEKTLVLSVSGGETSMMMAALVKQLLPFHNLVFIFANTGCENEETLEFVNKCDKHFELGVVWVEAVTNPEHGKGVTHKVTDFNNAFRLHQYKENNHPFHAHIRKNGIPNMSRPQCSDRLKEFAIEHYKKESGLSGCAHSLGMRCDEPRRTMSSPVRKLLSASGIDPSQFKRMEHQHRVNAFTSSGYDYSEKELKQITNYSKKLRKYNLVYLLSDAWEIDKQDVNTFWESQPFRLDLKDYQGNCATCWKKSDKKLAMIAKESPEKFEAFDWFERTYGDVKPQDYGKATFFRRYRSSEIIVQEAHSYSEEFLSRALNLPEDSESSCGASCESYII